MKNKSDIIVTSTFVGKKAKIYSSVDNFLLVLKDSFYIIAVHWSNIFWKNLCHNQKELTALIFLDIYVARENEEE